MGKIRVKTLGDESFEKEQEKQARARRMEKKAKKSQVHGVGLKGGQRIAVIEGDELTTEAKEAILAAEGTPEEKAQKKTKKLKVRVRSKRYLKLREMVDTTKLYPLTEAIELVQKTSTTKFDGSVETHISINPQSLPKDKKNISGAITFPHGTGKKRIIVIADEALIEKIAKGTLDFDVLVAHPSLMPKLARVAKILGPKGLMPNPKNGTISPTPEKRAKELEGGEMTWKSEADQPVIHQIIGKVSFTDKQLIDNIKVLITSINANKITKLTLSSSMGPGIKVDIKSL